MHGRFSFRAFSWEKSDVLRYINIFIHIIFIIFPLLKIYLFFSLISLDEEYNFVEIKVYIKVKIKFNYTIIRLV